MVRLEKIDAFSQNCEIHRAFIAAIIYLQSLSLSNRAVCFKTKCAAEGESYHAGNGQASLGECTEKHVALAGIQIDTF